MRTGGVLLLALLTTTACSAGMSKEDDQLCAAIAEFASTAGTDHTVVLRGGWGGDRPDSLMTHECRHFGHEPGKLLCAYLIPNTSWEFGRTNVKRAATCLDSPDRQDFMRRLDAYEMPAEMTSSLHLLEDKNIRVRVRFDYEGNEISVLTLSAARVGD